MRHIYFVRDARGFIKIGYTEQNPRSRLVAMQTGNPEALELLATIPVASSQDERRLHKKFGHLHHRGEWFRAAPELLDFINNEATAAPSTPKRTGGRTAWQPTLEDTRRREATIRVKKEVRSKLGVFGERRSR